MSWRTWLQRNTTHLPYSPCSMPKCEHQCATTNGLALATIARQARPFYVQASRNRECQRRLSERVRCPGWATSLVGADRLSEGRRRVCVRHVAHTQNRSMRGAYCEVSSAEKNLRARSARPARTRAEITDSARELGAQERAITCPCASVNSVSKHFFLN